jgi:N-methylhydantoinase B
MTSAASTAVDPVTYEVIRHRLTAITAEQSVVLKTVSGSPVVTDANDFNTGLYLPDGSIVTMGPHVIYHAGSLSRVISHVLADCGDNPGIHERDAFICNDPYKGALHPPDVTIVEPIFFEGELVAWTGACAHQLDVGGMEPGSWCPKATEVQQEGLILPPVKLVDRGTVRQDVWNLVMNMTRLPFIVALDLKAMMATNNLGRTRLLELIARYGLDTVRSVMQTLLERSANRFRSRLLELPDGVFRARNFLDHDGHENRLYTVALELTKDGDRLVFDYSQSSPQASGFVNCTDSCLNGAVYAGVLPLLAYDIPWNSGILAGIEVVAPKGLVVNAERPAPCGSATLGAGWLVEVTTVEAVSRLLLCSDAYRDEAHATTLGGLDLMTFGGVNQYGEPFGNTSTDQMAGGAGAYRHRRGTDYGGCHTILTQSIPNVETLENFSPILYLRRGLAVDSGGPGRFPGGSAAGASFMVHDAPFMGAVLEAHGVEVPNSLGLGGGHPGSCNHRSLARQSDVAERLGDGQAVTGVDDVEGAVEVLGAKPGRLMFGPGDVFDWRWQGGGGYGDPLDAPPADVAADVADGAISPEMAARAYGVVVAADGSVEGSATERRREEIRNRRRARPCATGAAVTGAGSGNGDATVVARLGDHLEVVAGGGLREIRCSCGQPLGPADGNWKDHATRAALTEEDLGSRIRLHAELELREYCCGGCGRLHSVELSRREDGPLLEVELR